MTQKPLANARFLPLATITIFLTVLVGSPILAQPPDGADRGRAAQLVARFLQLSEEQRQEWQAIRIAAQEAIAPVADELAATEAEFRELVGSDDPDPTALGNLLLSIKALKGEIQVIARQARADFEAILDEEQMGRLQRIRRVAPLCEVIPAFRALHLL